MEKLNRLIKRQKEFQKAVNLPIDSFVDSDRNRITEDYLFLTIKEIIELSREFPSMMNKWSKHNKVADPQRIKEEFSDILLFLINISIVWKLSPEEIMKQLIENQINNFNKLKLKKMDFLNTDILKVPGTISGIGQGNLNPKFIFIGQNPHTRITQGYKFWSVESDGSSQILLPILDDLNIKKDSYFTNVVKCTTTNNIEPTIEHVDFYMEFLRKELEILNMGNNNSIKIIAMGKWVDKILTLNKIEHSYIPHPSFVLRGGITRNEFYQKIKLFI